MIVLDTHAWIWWVSNPEKLSKKARKLIVDAMDQRNICISAISAWEAALLVARGRLRLTMDVGEWIQESEKISSVKFIPVTNAIAVKSVFLPGRLHDDPADRMIIATALTLGATVISKDKKIRDYGHVNSLW
ncbi:MAG: type II toxin-antitoxin system VapC family toxin [Methylococcales bacterium]